MNIALGCLVVLSLFVCYSHAAPSSYEITSLPGLTQPINFKMYSGYINVNQQMGKNLFFWFVTSQRNASSDPLLLWMNGGPGASSLLGFFEEHGPFRPNSDGKTLSLDPYAWNQIANIIYLEAPAGVGFSYAVNTSAYTTNDQITAQDNYQFLLNWFALFPEFKSNDFYITGESYGGHYVPELASLVLDGLQNGTNNINIKGLMAGNPGTNNDWYYNEDEWAFITFMYSHGLIPQTAYSNCVAACGWDHFLVDVCTKSFNDPTADCRKATARAISYLPRNIDMYDIYAPVCHQRSNFGEYISRWHPLKKVDPTISFDPCLQEYTTSYLNQPAVQQAIHARPTQWEWVSSVLNYQNETANMIPLWQRFLNETNWRMLVYSGDVDAAVPFLDTQSWISCLGQPIIRDWHNWSYNKQIAGSLIEYKGITFLTVKGAGHMVPYYLPPQGYAFYERWLQNQNI